MNLKLRDFVLWVIIVLVLLGLFTLFQNSAQRPVSRGITFSQLLNDVDQGKVREVVIRGAELHAVYKDGRGLDAYAPNEPGLAQRLHDKGVNVAAHPPQDDVPWFVSLLVSWLPFIVLIAVWIFLSRQIRSGRRMFGYGKGATISDKVLGDPTYWRDRAEEARAASGLMSDHESKRRMVDIIRGYEYLADRAEQRLRGSEPST